MSGVQRTWVWAENEVEGDSRRRGRQCYTVTTQGIAARVPCCNLIATGRGAPARAPAVKNGIIYVHPPFTSALPFTGCFYAKG